MIDIAKLRISVDKSQVDQATKSIEDLSKVSPEASGAVDKLTRTFNLLRNPVVLATAALVGATAAALRFAAQSIAINDSLGKMSRVTGNSSEQLQILTIIAQKGGTTLESLNDSLNKLSVRMVKLGDEDSSSFSQALEFFNVKLEDSNGKLKSSATLANEVAKAYSESEKTTYAKAAATEVLGKSFESQLEAMVQLNNLELEMEKNRKAGAIASEELIAASERYNDSLDDLSLITQGVGNYTSSIFLPLQIAVSESLFQSATNGGALNYALDALGKILQVVASAMKVVATALIGLDTGFQVISKSIELTINLFDAMIDWDVGKAKKAWKDYTDSIVATSMTANKSLNTLWSTIDSKGPPIQAQKGVDRGTFTITKPTKSSKSSSKDDAVSEQWRQFDEAMAAEDARIAAAERQAASLGRLRESYTQMADPLAKYRKQLDDIDVLMEQFPEQSELWMEAAMNIHEKMDQEGKKTVSKQKDLYSELVQAVEGYTKKMGDAFVDFAVTGKLSFKGMVSSIMLDLARLLANNAFKQIFSSIGGSDWGKSITSFFIPSANGNVFAGNQVVPFANGGLIQQPTSFALKDGIGRAGEAGTEAIVPLRRGASGRLGVELTGSQSGQTSVTNITLNNNINVETSNQSNPNEIGRAVGEQIKAIVISTIREQMRPGNTLNPIAVGGF